MLPVALPSSPRFSAHGKGEGMGDEGAQSRLLAHCPAALRGELASSPAPSFHPRGGG